MVSARVQMRLEKPPQRRWERRAPFLAEHQTFAATKFLPRPSMRWRHRLCDRSPRPDGTGTNPAERVARFASSISVRGGRGDYASLIPSEDRQSLPENPGVEPMRYTGRGGVQNSG